MMRLPQSLNMDTIIGNTSEREPVILKLKSNRSTVLSFKIDEGDVGGTLAVELAIYNTKVMVVRKGKYMTGYGREDPPVR